MDFSFENPIFYGLPLQWEGFKCFHSGAADNPPPKPTLTPPPDTTPHPTTPLTPHHTTPQLPINSPPEDTQGQHMRETPVLKVTTIWGNKNVWMFTQHGLRRDRVTAQRCHWKVPKWCRMLGNRRTINHEMRKWKEVYVRMPGAGEHCWPAQWFLAWSVLHSQNSLVLLCSGQGRQLGMENW